MSAAGLPVEEYAKAMGVDPRELAAAYERMEASQLQELKRAMHAENNRRPFECRALPQGARVAARIPEKLFFNLFFKKGFGMQERIDAQDLREVVKAFPQCRVETVPDKIRFGYTGRGGRHAGRRGVKFDTNIKFAT